MKKVILILAVTLFSITAFAQDKSNANSSPATQSDQPKVINGEIQLDALHLEAIIEKPSVSIVPKRIEPDLEKVEFINRRFDREVKLVPEELFSLQIEKNRVQKIRDIDSILKKARN